MNSRYAGPALALCLISAAFGQQAEEDRDRQVMERFLSVLERAPRRGTALDRVYGYHVERGSLDSLIKTYLDRTAKDPNDGNDWLLLGLIESQRGRDSAAVEAFRKAEAGKPDDALPGFYLGQALVLVGQPAEAAEAFERALTRHPSRNDLLEIFQALGRVHQRARRDDKALEVWSRLEKLFPDDPRVQEQVASALAEESKLEPALARYEAMATSTRDPYRRVRFRAEAADLKVRLGRQDDALRDYEGMLAGLDPESWLFREVRRKIEEVFTRNDDQAGLAKYYERWVEKSPEDVDAMARLGRTLAGLGRAEEARGQFDRALKLAPSNKRLRLALIEPLANARKFAEAAEQYGAMAKVEPNNPDVVRDWGRMLLRDGSKPELDRKKAAAEVWRKLVEARPDDPPTASTVADLLRQAGMVDEAILLYKKAVELAPGSPQYREYLGEYYHHLKRPDEALAVWRGMAEGGDRSAASLARLGDVLANYGYRGEAIAAVEEAVKLDPASYPNRLRLAGLLKDARRFDDAEAQLVAAGPLAEGEEGREEVLGRRIAVDEAAGRLGARIEVLKAEAAKAGDASTWRALARYDEAARRPVEATAAAEKAVALEPNSASSRATLARLYEATGRYGEAADAFRALATLDRRARSEHLSGVARLEVRLGRKDEALKAGREVLAATPGNPDAYQLYADLCFQLGENEEGLQALRRAARANDSDVAAHKNLAEALAREFRTEEAIEAFWKAFEKATDLDARLAIVAGLADLHLLRNQFDRLTGRLERLQAEDGHRREATLFLAQAYSSMGDFGSARRQLEPLLEANGRDTALLKQLSKLAEDEGDLPSALKFQRQLYEVAPDWQSTGRLVQLALRSGDFEAAEAVWSGTSANGQDLSAIMTALEGLGTQGRFETVLATTGRLLRADPGNWEALYREGRTLASLGRADEASTRFRALLDLKVDDDEVSSGVKARRKTFASSGGVSPTEMVGLIYRVFSGYSTVKFVSGLTPGYATSTSNSWSPSDFGTARMAALAHEIARARRSGTEAEWFAARREAAARGPVDPRAAWDDYYAALLSLDPMPSYEAAKALVRAVGHDSKSDVAFLQSMSRRNASAVTAAVRIVDDSGPDRTPPLPPDEVDLVRDALRPILRPGTRWGSVANVGVLVSDSLTELRRAGRLGEVEPEYRALVDLANDPYSITVAEYAASGRGDLDALRKLSEAFYKLPASSRTPGRVNAIQSWTVSTTQGIVPTPEYFMAMATRAVVDARRYDEMLRLVDDAMAAARSPARAAQRTRANQTLTGVVSRNAYPVFTSRTNTGGAVSQVIDYPSPNRFLDSGAILLLRGAFVLLKRDNHQADLVAHLKKAAETATNGPSAEAHARLALAAALWWSEDRDGALKELARAAELVPGDADLKFALAEMRALRKEPDEALAVVDSVEAVDQDLTRRRELLALRLAVQTGRADRARQAAERLFGLRIDSTTQVQLAAQMHQLGMHELAEAVLARTRRQVGNNTDGLAELMGQYRRQGNVESAAEIALLLVRRSFGAMIRQGAVEDVTTRQAIEILSSSGRLKDLIERVEAQVKLSPQSLPLRQTLVAYYRAAGRPDKVREANEAIIALRPDDVGLRMQVANSLVQAGDVDAALEHYRAASKVDPSMITLIPTPVFTAFQQAKRSADLADLIEQVGLKSFNDPVTVRTLVAALMKDPKSFDRGADLLVKAAAAFPADRQTLLLGAVPFEAFWARPDACDLARAAILPAPAAPSIEPWSGLDSTIMVGSWGSDGQIATLLSRLLDTSARSGTLDDLASSAEAALARHPGWLGGKALLGAVRLRQGRVDEGRKALEALLDEPNTRATFEALATLGQEVRAVPGCEALAIALYERAMRTDRAITYASLYMPASPVRHLALLYRKAGRVKEAIAHLRRSEESIRALNTSASPVLAAYRQVACLGGIGSVYLEVGDPVDAVRVFDELLRSPDEIQLARTYVTRDYIPNADALVKQSAESLDAAFNRLDREALAPTLDELIRPTDAARPVNLLLAIQPREVDQASVRSLLASALAQAAGDPATLAKVKADLESAEKARPGDFEVKIALALAAGNDPGALAASATALGRLADESPPDAIPAGSRPNARQRDEAARRVGLGLVARACWAHDSTFDIGDRLASKALEAARRQPDIAWSLALIRERGQVALDKGDRPGAEARWSGLLDLILADALAPVAPSPARPAPEGRPAPRPRAPALSVERFRQATEVARLAAENGLADLSLKAVRESLKGGPPVVPVAMPSPSAVAVRTVATGAEPPPDPALQLAEARLVELDRLWAARQVPDVPAYEAFRDAVLPPARPSEVFVFDPSTARSPRAGTPVPTEVARILARRALDAGRLDDLRKRLDARKDLAPARDAARRLQAAIDEVAGGR